MSRLTFLESCVSTQDELASILLLNPESFSAVCTFNQTGGRGQYGNSWKDTMNEGIAISFGLKKNQKTVSDSLFNFYTAVLLRDFVANMTNEQIFIKWPNDLILNSKKIAGILMEKKKINSEDYFIIGIGINVLQNNFGEITKAGSIYSETNKIFDLKDFAHALFQYLETKFEENREDESIISRYHQFLFKKDEISVFEKKGIRQNGIIKKVDKDGFLWVDLENEGLRKFFNKEITRLY